MASKTTKTKAKKTYSASYVQQLRAQNKELKTRVALHQHGAHKRIAGLESKLEDRDAEVLRLQANAKLDQDKLLRLEKEAKEAKRLKHALKLVRDMCDHVLGGWDKAAGMFGMPGSLWPLLIAPVGMMLYLLGKGATGT